MYKIIKSEGKASDVYLLNTETNAQINLGRITPTLYDILIDLSTLDLDKCDGMNYIKYQKWDFPISTEIVDKLREYAMPMKRVSKRMNRNNTTQEEIKEEIIDLTDLFGSMI